MSDIVAFLLARVAEDERAANETACLCGGPICGVPTWYGREEAMARFDDKVSSVNHLLRWSPQRVLTECAAKRAIIEPYARDQAQAYGARRAPWGPMGPYATMQALALAYSDHPDFDPAWTYWADRNAEKPRPEPSA